MKNLMCSAIFLFWGLMAVCGHNNNMQYSMNGWNINVDLKNEQLSISNKDLGTVLDNIQLQIINADILTKLTDWQLKNDDDILIIQTQKPANIHWEFKVLKNKIEVTSTSKNTFITAIAPASPNRFPARIADPEKMVAVETNDSDDYTGVTQIEKYYVPTENPQIMYLSLGAIDSPVLHSLFDKQTDIAIQFPPGTLLKRLTNNQSFMKVEIPTDEKNDFVILIPDYYTKVLGMPDYLPYNNKYHKTAPTGWNSWLGFFRIVTENDIVDNARFIANNLKKYGMEHCQLDDGYDDTSRRLWSKNWDPVKFPHGPEWLAKFIKSQGLIPGLWTVPYSYSIADAKSDWFLRDDKGNILMDYQGGGELDFSRQDVLNEYWIPLWKEFKKQGWKYYKFDMGNTSWMWHTYQHNFSDTTISSYEAAKKTMNIFRDIMGPKVWHTNHPDADGGRLGYIDVAGCGKDPGVGWKNMNNFLEVISNNEYQNHIIWYSDPDCIVLRGKPARVDTTTDNTLNDKFLTFEEAKTCASLLSLSGMQYLSGDDLVHLENERLDLIKKTIPVMPIFPVDLFGRSRYPEHYPEIMDLKVNQVSGIYDVIAITNRKDEPVTRSVSFSKDLALNADQTYIVFDFWKEQMMGLFNENFKVEIPAHGTCVFLIHEQEKRPQLLGTNRHISGAFSIKKNNWNQAEMTLKGVSETVPEVKYSLYYYVPKNILLDKIDVAAQVVTEKLYDNGLLKVSFTGQEKPVAWNLRFKWNK